MVRKFNLFLMNHMQLICIGYTFCKNVLLIQSHRTFSDLKVDVHSKVSLCDQNSPVAIAEVSQAATAEKFTDDVVIVVDKGDNPDKDEIDNSSYKKRSPRGITVDERLSESVGSSSLATSASEQPHKQSRRRFSNISNLALSLPSTTPSSSMSGGVYDVDSSKTTGGSLDPVGGVKQRFKVAMAGDGTSSRDCSHCNSLDILQAPHKDAAAVRVREDSVDDEDSGDGVVGDDIQGRVRKTSPAHETSRGVKAGAIELVAGDCDSLSEEIASKSPLLVQRDKYVEGRNQPKDRERQLEARHRPLGSCKYEPFPTRADITSSILRHKTRVGTVNRL